jgi:hypothetical protein
MQHFITFTSSNGATSPTLGTETPLAPRAHASGDVHAAVCLGCLRRRRTGTNEAGPQTGPLWPIAGPEPTQG